MIGAALKIVFLGISRLLVYFFSTWIRKRWNWIYLVLTLLYFWPAFQFVEFNAFFSVILLLIALPLAMFISSVVTSVRFTVVAISSGPHIRDLATKYPEFAELEQKYRALLSFSRKVLGVTIVLAVLSYLAYQLVGVSITLLVMMGIYKLLLRNQEAILEYDFKMIAVLTELNRAFTDVRYDSKKCFSSEEISELRLFKSFSFLTGNDLIEARRGGKQFRYCDIKIERYFSAAGLEGENSNKTTVVFQGSALHFVLNEPSPVRLVAATENFTNLMVAGSALQKAIKRAGDHSVETEMDAFNRRFDVFCTDQTAARILLTPQMIEGIYRVGTFTKQGLVMLFEDNNLYVFLSTPETDSMEIAVSGQRSLKKQHEAIGKHVSLIASMIDAMYLKGAE